MREQRAFQRNAADPKQVRFAERKEKERGERFRAAMRVVMALPAGRIVLWDLVARAGIFHSIWDPSSKIHYNAGRQDYGHELLATLIETDEDLYQLMEREARAFERRQDHETAAAQTPAANEGATTNDN